MTIEKIDLSNLVDQLLQSWEKALSGEGSLWMFSDPEGLNFHKLFEEVCVQVGPEFVKKVDLAKCYAQSYAPLLGLVQKENVDLDQVYFRHRALWSSLFQDTVPNPQESLILEEASYERGHIEETLLNSLGKGIIFCHNAQGIPAETARLLSEESKLLKRPLIILLGFQQDPWADYPALPSNSFFRTRFTQGRVITLGTQIVSGDQPLGPSLDSKELNKIEVLSQWLCHDHALDLGTRLYLTSTLNPQLLNKEEQQRLFKVLALCHETRDEFDKGLFFGQILSRMQDPSKDLNAFIETQTILARLYKGTNDREAGVQAAFLAWQALQASQDHILHTKTDFTLFLLNSQSPEYKDAYTNLHDRLIEELLELKWNNHLAYVLTQNMAVMELYWKSGWNQAFSRCQWGRQISEDLGNRRRLVTAFHSMATLYQIQGDFSKAEKHFLKAGECLKGVSKPYEEAGNDNGIGYFYFVLGRYRQSFQKHSRALARLFRTRYYVETLSTLINLSRLYLFNGQAKAGLALMEGIFQILDRLNIPDIPFHPQRNLFSIMGLLCLKSGQTARAQEFFRKIQGLPSPRRALHSSDYQLYFEGVFLAHAGDRARSIFKFEEASGLMEQKLAESGHLLIHVLIAFGQALQSWGLEDQAMDQWKKAKYICSAGHDQEKKAIDALLSNLPIPEFPHLPGIDFDSEVVLQFVDQDASVNRLQRKLKEFNFLQKWQDLLKLDVPRESLIESCCALIHQNFPVNEVVIINPGKTTENRPDLKAFLQQQVPIQEDRPKLFLPPEIPEGFTSLSYLPIFYEGKVRTILMITTQGARQHLSEEDHNLLVMASSELAVTLLAALRSEQLAGRQAALENSNRELSKTLSTLRDAQAHLVQAEKMSALGNLVAGVAHEINTPLGVAITAVSYLKEKSDALKKALLVNQLKKSDLERFVLQNEESADMVMRNLTRAEELIQSFKLVAADQSSEHRRSFDLILLSLRPRWKKTLIRVEAEGETGLVIDSYPGAVAQVVTNLLVNSLMHGFDDGDEGIIKIRLSRVGSQILMVVEDNGKGITEENMGKIFEPFFTTKRGHGGTGLGLHIVFNLVNQRLGGTINCQSNAGIGTRFLVYLPLEAPGKVIA